MISNTFSYDAIADDFNASRKKVGVSEVVERFGEFLKPGTRVLDVGCGSGLPIDKYLAENGLQVTGIDISKELLQLAKVNVAEGEFIESSIQDFETDKKFDGIVACDSLFHLQLDEHEIVFAKLYDFLNDGGYFFFTHGGTEGEVAGEMFGQLFTYSSPGPAKIKEVLQNLGFKILEWRIDTTESNGYLIALAKK